jgi:hypothetical protein
VRFRSKPQFVEAVQYDGTLDAIKAARRMGAKFVSYGQPASPGALLAGKDGAQGWVDVPVGHWIVTDGSGNDFWPVEHEYFTAKYEPAEVSA